MAIYSALCTHTLPALAAKSNPRGCNPTKLMIHHMAGKTSGIQCAQYHLRGPEASANYYAGYDGDLCGGVPEELRAWTSGGDIDNKCITFEIADEVVAEPYPISVKTYNTVIQACAEICLRRGITPHYDGTINGTILYHQMVGKTACPGTTLINLIKSGQFENDIKRAMQAMNDIASVPTGSVSQANTGNIESDIWNFLTDKGLNAYAAAGLMGNLYAESGLNPQNLQNTYEKKFGMNDAQYTQAVDSGSYTSFATDSAGYGLAQWTYHTRKQSLLHYARSTGQSIGSLSMQLAFLWQELQGYTAVITTLKNASSVRVASDAVLTGYEKPADQSEAVKAKRASFGQIYFDKYAGKVAISTSQTAPTGGATSYRVRITADVLMIRKGAGTNYPAVGKIADRGVYTIVAESAGTGASKWGKLKSGAGWIALDYTTRL